MYRQLQVNCLGPAIYLLTFLKGEVHTFSISKYVDVLNKLERTKKPAGQKLFSFSYSRPPKLAILSHISDDVTGFKRPFSLYNSRINH